MDLAVLVHHVSHSPTRHRITKCFVYDLVSYTTLSLYFTTKYKAVSNVHEGLLSFHVPHYPLELVLQNDWSDLLKLSAVGDNILRQDNCPIACNMHWTNKRPILCHFSYRPKRQEDRTQTGRWMAPFTRASNPYKGIYFHSPDIAVLIIQAEISSSIKDICVPLNIKLRVPVGHTMFLKRKCWLMIKPYSEGEREFKKGTQKFLLLPFSVIKLNGRWQKQQLSNTKACTPRNEWSRR